MSQKEIAAYLLQLSPMEKQILNIAETHLETSFSLVKSIGFQEWQQAQAEQHQPLRRSNPISSDDMWTSEPLAYYKAIDITEEEQFISAVDDVEDFEHDGITYDREYGTNWLYQADYETKMWELVGKWVPEHNWVLPVNVV